MAKKRPPNKKRVIMRNLLLLLVCLAAVGTVALAQDDEPEERELITVLKMGEGVFETGLWQASGSELLASTTATWQSTLESGFSALSFLNYIHFDTGYTLDGLDDFFNDAWFEQSFANWEEVRKTNVCFDDDITLHEFTLSYLDANGNLTDYAMRYWVDPLNETRVRTWHIAFATTFSDGTPNPEGQEQLDEYASRIYPDFASCAA